VSSACVVPGQEDAAGGEGGGFGHHRHGGGVHGLDYLRCRQRRLELLAETRVRVHQLEGRRVGVGDIDEHTVAERIGPDLLEQAEGYRARGGVDHDLVLG
jgi:hypothetical protein